MVLQKNAVHAREYGNYHRTTRVHCAERTENPDMLLGSALPSRPSKDKATTTSRVRKATALANCASVVLQEIAAHAH